MKAYAFDIESYPNFFSCVFIDCFSDEKHVFYAHSKGNNILAFLSFVNKDHYLIGYNSLNFDSPIISYIAMNHMRYRSIDTLLKAINEFATKLIELQDTEYYWSDKDINLVRKYTPIYYNMDMFRVLALNKIRKSLKQSAVNLKWHRIQELPIPPGSHIEEDQYDLLLDYNDNDADVTKKLFLDHIDEVKLRFKIRELYNVDVINSSRSAIADKLLNKFYSEISGLNYYDFKDLRTERRLINMKDCISNKVKFTSTKLNDFLIDLRSRYVYNTKQDLKMSIVFNYVRYNLGTGGLHSEDPPDVFNTSDKMLLVDADVTSYYPNLIIKELICPAHLNVDAFVEVVRMIKDDRVGNKAKAKLLIKNGLKDSPAYIDAITRADALKIVVNAGGFGKMGYEFYWLYDRRAMVQVTINGQLFLLMLIEALTEKGFQVISANTDGVVTLVPKDREKEYISICETWEVDTKLNLEYTYYSKYVRRDVNNYLAIETNGGIKRKGTFSEKIEITKGYPIMVIPKAVNKYFIDGTDVKDTILKHRDIYDFCTSQKVGKKYNVELHYIKDGSLIKEPIQRVVRFYIANKGGYLYKVEDAMLTGNDSKVGIKARHKVRVFNDYFEPKDGNFSNYDIDYNYYIREAQELVDKIIYRIKKKGPKVSRIKAGGSNKSNIYTNRLFDNI